MKVWEWVSSVNDVIKERTPDVTPAADACRKSYNICRESTTSLAREAQVYLWDDQVRENVGHLAKHGAIYIAKSYGGGPIVDIVSRSVQEKKVDPHKRRMDELEAKVALFEKQLSLTKAPGQTEIQRVIIASSVCQEEQNQKPEDVLHRFMKEEFVGTTLFDNLMIPCRVRSKRT